MDTAEINERADALVCDLIADGMVLDSRNGIIYRAILADGSKGGSGLFGNYSLRSDSVLHFDTGVLVSTWIGKRRMKKILTHFA